MKNQPAINVFKISVTAFVDWVGRTTITSILYITHLLSFTFIAFLSMRLGSKRTAVNRRSVVSQIIFGGIDALPTITIIGFAIAISVTAQFIFILQSIITEKELMQVLMQIIAQEFAPLLTAIILIGRSGSAITVDLGNMRVHKEIRGLELLGIDITSFFVLPRILGMAISQFALAVYFSSIVIVAGIIFSALFYSPSHFKYIFILVDAITPYEVLIFLIKNLWFGIIIGATACFHGLRVNQSITEVPQQTQRAIVSSLILVFIVDGILVLAK